MRAREYRIGPGASSLLLILLVLTLTTLGMLSLMSARADWKLSARARDMTQAYYAADAAVQERLMALDELLADARAGAKAEAEYRAAVAASLPDWASLSGDEIAFSQDAGGSRVIEVRLQIVGLAGGARYEILSYALVDEMDWEAEPLELMGG